MSLPEQRRGKYSRGRPETLILIQMSDNKVAEIDDWDARTVLPLGEAEAICIQR